MMPTKEEKEEMKRRKMKVGSDDDSENGTPVHQVIYEMQPGKMPQENHVPFTPRTQAFHALDRKMPLRGS